MMWGSNHGRDKRFFLLPHKKKTVQIANFILVPKLRINETTGPLRCPLGVNRYNFTFTCIFHVF